MTKSSPEAARRPDPRPAATRRAITTAALELIAELGFEGATIERIAERSGVSRSTIYRHWPDPSRLYLEAFDPADVDDQLPPASGDSVADLEAYVRHAAARLNDDLFAAALTAQIDKGRRDPEYRAAQLAYALGRNSAGVRIFQSGIDSGVFRPGLDPVFETDLVLSFLVYTRLLRYQTVDEGVIQQLMTSVLERCQADNTR